MKTAWRLLQIDDTIASGIAAFIICIFTSARCGGNIVIIVIINIIVASGVEAGWKICIVWIRKLQWLIVGICYATAIDIICSIIMARANFVLQPSKADLESDSSGWKATVSPVLVGKTVISVRSKINRR